MGTLGRLPGQEKGVIQALTWRLGLHVGLSPLLSLSISSMRSDVVLTDRPGVGEDGPELSGTGPSQRSVRMLSSESWRLKDMEWAWLCRETRSGIGLATGDSDRGAETSSSSRFSRNMGILVLVSLLQLIEDPVVLGMPEVQVKERRQGDHPRSFSEPWVACGERLEG